MKPNRRGFVVTAAGAAACALCGACGCASSGSKPGGGEDAEDAKINPGPVDIGPAANYAAAGVSTQFAKTGGVFVVSNGGNLTAVSSVCTHKNCILKYKDDSLRCPCHGSRFRLDGAVIKGPAKTPLPQYAVTQGSNGSLVVDKTRKLAPGEGATPLNS